LSEITYESAYQPPFVNTLVLIETLVLSSNERIAHMFWNFGQRDPDAALVLLKHFSEAPAFDVEHDALAGKLETLEFMMVRKGGGCFIVVIYHFTQIDDGSLNLLVPAELPVCRLQISKIDAAELPIFIAQRPRIVHSGLNEVIKIDVLDLEGLDHVGAAGLQQLGELLPIAIAIELCLHYIGSYRHLAERQRRGKNFDEGVSIPAPISNWPGP
jgi:hypothetical protein